MSSEALDDAGFRIRGVQATRVDAFVDAAFAFAVTLLVVSIGHIPESAEELGHAMLGVPAFAASFLLLARSWMSHRTWSRRYGIEDHTSLRLSLALVFVVLVYVYPLRMVAQLLLYVASSGRLVEQAPAMHTLGDLRVVYATFAIGFGVVSAITGLLYRHAWSQADAIALSAAERIRTRRSIERYMIFVGVALLSLALTFLLPVQWADSPWYVAAPGFVYALIIPLGRWAAWRERRALAAIGAA